MTVCGSLATSVILGDSYGIHQCPMNFKIFKPTEHSDYCRPRGTEFCLYDCALFFCLVNVADFEGSLPFHKTVSLIFTFFQIYKQNPVFGIQFEHDDLVSFFNPCKLFY